MITFEEMITFGEIVEASSMDNDLDLIQEIRLDGVIVGQLTHKRQLGTDGKEGWAMPFGRFRRYPKKTYPPGFVVEFWLDELQEVAGLYWSRDLPGSVNSDGEFVIHADHGGWEAEHDMIMDGVIKQLAPFSAGYDVREVV